MICSRLDRLSARFREALGSTHRWTIEQGTLTLLDESGAALARFEAAI